MIDQFPSGRYPPADNCLYSLQDKLFPPAAAGLTLIESCLGCGHKVYAIAESTRLIDAAAGTEVIFSSSGRSQDINSPATAWRAFFGKSKSRA
jgi:hypothetical protein